MIKNGSNVFMGDSVYHLYLSMLMAAAQKKKGEENYLLVFTGKTKGIESIGEQLKKVGLFDDIDYCNGYAINKIIKKNHSKLAYLTRKPQLTISAFEAQNQHLEKWKPIFAESCFRMFQLNRSKNYFFLKYPDNEVYMYEDGLGSYDQTMPVARKWIRSNILKMPLLKGHDNNVTRVYVQQPDKLKDPVIRKKAHRLDLKQLEDQLDPDLAKRVVDTILGDTISLKNLYNTGIIITQPVVEDGFTRDTQLELYKGMVNDALNKTSKVYIKVHPRDDSSIYEPLLNDKVILLPQLFPLEIFNLITDLRFKIGMTYYSSSLGNLNSVDESVFYHPKYRL